MVFTTLWEGKVNTAMSEESGRQWSLLKQAISDALIKM
jgi:hypothetical protein